MRRYHIRRSMTWERGDKKQNNQHLHTKYSEEYRKIGILSTLVPIFEISSQNGCLFSKGACFRRVLIFMGC